MAIEIELSGGLVVRGSLSKPEGECRGAIVLIHGLGEHFGRYSAWAGRFVSKKYTIAGADLPGHGISDGRRGHIRSYDLADELIGRLIGRVTDECRGAPVILYGHSLGGGMVLRHLIVKRPSVACAVVTSPWLKLSFEPPRLKLLLAMAVKRVLPALVQPSGLVVNYLSRNEDVIKAYIADPLVHDRISVSLFYGAISAATFALKNAGSLNVPLLLMHGGGDMITSPEGSRLFAGSSAKTSLRIWEGGYHELHNDIISDEVFGFVNGWLLGMTGNKRAD